MKLRRIRAEAFGALRECSLDGIGDGLTVVLGPNESGKSTYATLVRQVLYGFPDRRSRDYGYLPRAGARAGSLTFESPDGRWSITRTDGSKGGTVAVETLSGHPRPQLLSEIVGRVTPETFRVVFGFGLDELNDIESGSDADVMARLSAGAYGLRVNPLDVRREIAAAADAAFKPRGASAIGEAGARMREVQASIRDIEAQARDFAGAQERAREMDGRLAPLKARRDAVDVRRREAERDLARARTLASRAEETREGLRTTGQLIEDRTREHDRVVVDERLLAIEPELVPLLDQESGAVQHLNHAKQLESVAAENRRAASALAALSGVDAAGAREHVEAWRDRRARLQAEVDASARAALDADARAAAARDTAGGPAAGDGATGRSLPLLGILVTVVGLAAVVAGLLTAQWIAAGAGAAAVGLGVLVFVLARQARAGSTLPVDLQRLELDARTAQAQADGHAELLAREAAEWERWLSTAGLDARGAEPAAVIALLEEAARRATLEGQAASREDEAARERAEYEGWAQQLVSRARGPLGVAESAPDPRSIAIRTRDALAAARDARDRKAALAAEIENAQQVLQRGTAALEGIQAELDDIARAHGFDGDPVPRLETTAEALATELSAVGDEYEALVREHAELVGSLGVGDREDALAQARQQLEGLRATAREAADRHLVESLAVRLIDMARERYERERQPAVVRTAARIFVEMTGGRYTDVIVPLDKERISVVSASGAVLPTSDLSRGTAEQLYLALRVGLIESFGEQGPHLPVLMDDIVVNYDLERLAGAGAAVSALASSRQVIFFTCHEHTASLLSGAVPGSTVLELDRCHL